MQLPRISHVSQVGSSSLWLIDLTDWEDIGRWYSNAEVIWSTVTGVQCPAKDAYRWNRDCRDIYPGTTDPAFAFKMEG